MTGNQTEGVIHMCHEPLELQQGSYGQEHGFSLALYKLAETCKVIHTVGDVYCTCYTNSFFGEPPYYFFDEPPSVILHFVLLLF